VTGSHQNFHKYPDYPITPKQIADSCLEARRAGAAIVHVHVRDPETGAATGEVAHYREVVERLRDSGSDLLINLTTGFGGRFAPGEDDPRVAGPGTSLIPPEARVAHVEEIKPEICTLDVGTFNFGASVFMNTPDHLRIMAARIKAAGVKPEIEVFEPGHTMFGDLGRIKRVVVVLDAHLVDALRLRKAPPAQAQRGLFAQGIGQVEARAPPLVVGPAGVVVAEASFDGQRAPRADPAADIRADLVAGRMQKDLRRIEIHQHAIDLSSGGTDLEEIVVVRREAP
jgi:hypothetical protein